MGKFHNAEIYRQFSPLRDYDEYKPDYEPDTKYGYCPECACNVEAKRMDFGIGAYEYWGSKEVHKDIRDVCPRCETEVLDEQPEEEEEES
ncbi:hypothetical protein LMG22037_05490 [Paraburkholderia phenoliruptrix]|uniref:Uncharacterized protein n=1 Tax=Paraburkholderia phenoliruptrix TaxID=252970 RepID=A0A6J5CAP1_9BURK|nr:hypothetical protein [Paraburkholderia phenoliruptrix]CAB3729939.1 hypothetical protein LMG22037_05490 [Paraburkholderia phenoliruptrix]